MNPYPGGHRLNLVPLLVCSVLALAFASSPALQAEPASFQVNDRVEANLSVFGWQKATVKELGQGDREGQLRILIDGNSADHWVSPAAQKFVRKLADAAPATPPADQNQPPRLSKYLIMSYGAPSNPPLHLGHFELLAGGNYRFLNMGGKPIGEGRYEYDGRKHEVRWISGPFLTNKWGGKFEISREGKTHNIRFTRTTLGTSNTD